MVVRDARLRQARERAPSRQYPGECLSRQELADQVNEYLWHTHEQRAEIDAGYIGKLERGVIQWPGERYRAALRAVLGVATDAELGFRNTRRATVPVSAAPVQPDDLFLTLATPVAVPHVVDDRHIRDVAAAAELFGHQDHLYGGWSLLDAALAQARWAGQLLKARCPTRLRADLHGAVADLVGTCGFKLFDVGSYQEANRYFRFALACTEQVGDWHRRARILARMVRLALETGQDDQALTLAEHALVRIDRLAPARQAMLHVAHAKALAAAMRREETIRAIAAADESFSRAVERDCASVRTDLYTGAHLAGETVEALAALRARGLGGVDIRERFCKARDGFNTELPRARVLAELKFASFTMYLGDPVEAAAVGATALDAARPLRSGRVHNLLRVLERASARQNIREVRDLRERLRVLTGAEPVSTRK